MHNDSEDHWIPLADIMTGLMLVFLLITFSYMAKLRYDVYQKEKVMKKTEMRKLFDMEKKAAIYKDLYSEFHSNLQSWQANIESQDLTINFYAPQVLFDTGKSDLQPYFKSILINFIPRYLKILKKHQANVFAVSIEGYSSNYWGKITDTDTIYLQNMELSQKRSLSVLVFLHKIFKDQDDLKFLRDYFTTSGLSSVRPVIEKDGIENKAKSQRVEFKILVKGTS